jgi:hypothetical protein
MILSDDYVVDLLAEVKELVDWQTLFADIICTTEDSGHVTIYVDLLLCWQDNISMSLINPRKNEEEIVGLPIGGLQDVDINFTVEPESSEEWTQAGLLPSPIKTLRVMEQGLDKANIGILGFIKNSVQWEE